MSRANIKDLLEKYFADSCTKEEETLLYQWFDSFQNDEEIWDELGNEKKQMLQKEVKIALDQRINTREKHFSGKRSFNWRIAASIILFIGIGIAAYFIPISENQQAWEKMSTDKGQKTTINLPDGSKVRLNAESTIRFHPNFSNNRSVELTGEAFFEVAEDTLRPFTITSGKLKTTVLGTSFNINAYPDNEYQQVTVVSGKVRVESENDHQSLLPGQMARYHYSNNSIMIETVQAENFIFWKDGIIKFDGNNLSEISEVLSRWYGVEIINQVSGSSFCELRLTFDNLALKQVLEQLALVTGIEYEFIAKNKIVIKGEGCIN